MAHKEKEVTRGSLHRRLKSNGGVLEDAKKIDKAKPSWEVKKGQSEGRERTSTTASGGDARRRTSTHSGRERSSTSGKHPTQQHHHPSHHHHNGDDDEYGGGGGGHRRSSRRSSTSRRESSAGDHHHHRRSSSHRQSVDHHHHHRHRSSIGGTSSQGDSKKKPIKTWEESLKEDARSRKKSSLSLNKKPAADSDDDSDDDSDYGEEFKEETKKGANLLVGSKWANLAKSDDIGETSRGKGFTKGGASGRVTKVEERIAKATPGQLRQLNWAAGVIQKCYRLTSKSLRVRRRLCGNRSYKGDRGQNLLVLYGWLLKKSKFGWEHKYCYVDPRDGHFKYAPRDVHNGTLPPGKTSLKQSKFTQLRWKLNGRQGEGGFDLHIVLPAEPGESDPKTFYFISHHKDVLLKAPNEQEANHWIDELHEWSYCFLHEKDNAKSR